MCPHGQHPEIKVKTSLEENTSYSPMAKKTENSASLAVAPSPVSPSAPVAPAIPLTRESLESECKGLVSAPQCLAAAGAPFYDRLLRYVTMLMQWNARMNLVGATSWQEAVENLCADSWHLADFLRTLPLPAQPECWDLGAGAGLPGVPLRLVWEEGSYTLVEAREKRALFLQSVLAMCQMPGVTVFRGRAEKFMEKAPPANLVLSRAFLPWEKVLELVGAFMAPEGLVVFLTLVPPPEQLPQGWVVRGAREYGVAGGGFRHFWALGKR